MPARPKRSIRQVDLGAANVDHQHTESDITDLDHYDSSDFAADHANADHTHDHDGDYAELGHTHTESDVTDLDHYDSSDFATDHSMADHSHDHDAEYANINHSHELDELDATAITGGHVLTAQGDGTAAWEAPVTGVTDHGLLDGLADDDHPQYLNTARHAATHTSARYRLSIDQTIPTATLVTVELDTVTFENDSGGDLSFNSSTGELTINTTGIYQLIGAIQWRNNNTGERQVRIAVNGSPIGLVRQQAIETSNGNISLLAELTANDVVTLVGRQTSGSDLDIFGSSGDTTFLAIIRVL